ncbi:MAG: hypothetical protein GYA24_20880, partial [Candidatus Lokiarchaeota archaeon]|nr:hypothetical protein [Candidatus Lokiarchaeota archaeon]
MTESKPPADATADDVTARVLAATKSLRDGFEDKYAAAAAKVKKEVEGPVKVIDTGDDIPITMQLSVWDTKIGPVPAMLVGGAAQLATISPAEQEDTTRMIDMLGVGATCDLSKAGVNRLLLKFGIQDPHARGGESWCLIATYYSPALDVPKAVIEEMLKELAASIKGKTELAAEAFTIREAYNPAQSKWRELLQEMRLSIWALVQKASELHPPPIPGMTTDETKAIFEEPPSPAIEVEKATPRKKKAKPRPEAEEATIFSKLARATNDAKERMKQAIDARIAAHKKVVVPPVAEVVPGAATVDAPPAPPAAMEPITPALPPAPPVVAPAAALPAPAEPVAGRVAPGFPTAPPHLMVPVAAPVTASLLPEPEDEARSPAEAPATPSAGLPDVHVDEDVGLPAVDKDDDGGKVSGADPLASIETQSGAEPVPIQITINKPSPAGPVTPSQPGDVPG